MNKKSISRNYLYNLSYQLLILITPFVTTPYLSRVLGAEGIGVYSYTTAIVSYFILFASLGVADYAQREIAYHQDDKHLHTKIFYEVVIIKLVLISINLVVYYEIVSKWNVDYTIYWIQALNIIAVLLDISWFFQGLEEFGKIVFRNLCVRVLNIILIFLLIHEPSDLKTYIFLMGTMNLISGALIWMYLPKYLLAINIGEIKPFRNIYIIIQMFLPQIAIQVYTVLDKTMIGIITDSSFENGYYEQATKIVRTALMVATSLGPVMVPRIAAAYAAGENSKIKQYVLKSYRFVCLIALPLMFGLIGVIDNIVPWFFGDGYEKVGILVKISSGVLLAIGINNVTGVQYLIPINRQKILTLTVVIGAVVNFLFNLVLIPIFLSVGAVISSVVAEFVIVLVQFWFVKKDFQISQIVYQAKLYIFSSLMMLMVLLVTEYYFILTTSFRNSIFLILEGGVVYFILLYCLKDELFLSIINKLMNYMKRKL